MVELVEWVKCFIHQLKFPMVNDRVDEFGEVFMHPKEVVDR
jgi:hypothetical protein